MNQEITKVTKIIDGDTIEISDGNRVRLICIDTPEVCKCVNNPELPGCNPYSKEEAIVDINAPAEGLQAEIDKAAAELNLAQTELNTYALKLSAAKDKLNYFSCSGDQTICDNNKKSLVSEVNKYQDIYDQKLDAYESAKIDYENALKGIKTAPTPAPPITGQDASIKPVETAKVEYRGLRSTTDAASFSMPYLSKLDLRLESDSKDVTVIPSEKEISINFQNEKNNFEFSYDGLKISQIEVDPTDTIKIKVDENGNRLGNPVIVTSSGMFTRMAYRYRGLDVEQTVISGDISTGVTASIVPESNYEKTVQSTYNALVSTGLNVQNRILGAYEYIFPSDNLLK